VDNGLLFFDFRFHGDRCREQTLLSDTPANRRKLEKVLDKIEAEIAAGTFVYANYFPNSKALARLERVAVQTDQIAVAPVGCDVHTADPIVIGDDTGSQTPTFSTFARDDHGRDLPELFSREHALFDGFDHYFLELKLIK